MWYFLTCLYLAILFISALVCSRITNHEIEARHLNTIAIAATRAHNLAYPTNTTVLAFGPQLYHAPLQCYDDSDGTVHGTILPGWYDVKLSSRHSIAAHQKVISYTSRHDIRPFIYYVYRLSWEYLETEYHAGDVDEELLGTIRSDSNVVLVSCVINYDWLDGMD